MEKIWRLMEAHLHHSWFLNQGGFPLPKRYVGQTETIHVTSRESVEGFFIPAGSFYLIISNCNRLWIKSIPSFVALGKPLFWCKILQRITKEWQSQSDRLCQISDWANALQHQFFSTHRLKVWLTFRMLWDANQSLKDAEKLKRVQQRPIKSIIRQENLA